MKDSSNSQFSVQYITKINTLKFKRNPFGIWKFYNIQYITILHCANRLCFCTINKSRFSRYRKS